MELPVRSLLLLVFIPFADACIPTKTPEPGIPAVTTTENPNKCTALMTLTVAECKVVIGPMNLVCADPIVTATSVTCPVANSLLIFKTGPGQNQAQRGTLMCKGTEWLWNDGSKLAANLLTSPYACVSDGAG